MKVLYTAAAMSTGDARNGHVRSSDGLLDFDLAIQKELGGAGGTTNPEQLFAAGYAACFHSALKAVARQKKIEFTDSAVSAEVGIGPNDAGGFALTVALQVEFSGIDQQTADELVQAAHQVCPYSNATRGNIPVTVEAVVA
ncbi:organic hydroperoxide resistance protein [Amycolatopsis rhizosphaerae]|uniref:Organic hydroperoxide resistance protein n=1 Tax=Amycolatopsis rhizosphaerae TaxID=2053003 RepID=A0A558CBQ9_9PSEU|nr:organic hydroperoxide resistance protein [Amycolatopsis rhizosphaerae]TVT46223.1 organic hydroperoxide resistance protein [Amycolatopsis rhizosphaerae]